MFLPSRKMSSDLPSKSHCPSTPTFSFYLDWTIRLLSLIAALLFGIWAPLAYTATLVANRDADAFQITLSHRLDELAAMQRTVHERLHELEMLKVWEFCVGPGMHVSACTLLMNGKGNQTVERLERAIGNAFDASMPTTTSTGAVSSSTGGGVVSRVPSSSSELRTLTSPASTISTASMGPTSTTPAVIGDSDPTRAMHMRGLGAAAGVIGIVALLAVMRIKSRSNAYRAYHRL